MVYDIKLKKLCRIQYKDIIVFICEVIKLKFKSLFFIFEFKCRKGNRN